MYSFDGQNNKNIIKCGLQGSWKKPFWTVVVRGNLIDSTTVLLFPFDYVYKSLHYPSCTFGLEGKVPSDFWPGIPGCMAMTANAKAKFDINVDRPNTVTTSIATAPCSKRWLSRPLRVLAILKQCPIGLRCADIISAIFSSPKNTTAKTSSGFSSWWP